MKKEDIILAIHHDDTMDLYSGKWIEYCNKNDIKYKIINCYDSSIMEILKEFDGLLWNWSHVDYQAQLFARQFIYSLEHQGFPVYPNTMSSIYFDDKLGQKYILESINAPLVPSHIFYDKKSANNWINSTSFPKVFKLRSGAGAHNVKLMRNKNEAKKYLSQAFGKGFLGQNRGRAFENRIWYFKRDKTLKSFFNISRGLYRFFFPHKKLIALPIEKNYFYAQDFIPNCDHDIRVFIVGDRALSKRRKVRDGDFRASGSGMSIFEKDEKHKEYVEVAFAINEKLKMQSIAFDFVKDQKGDIKLIEISYSTGRIGFLAGVGYWNKDLSWTSQSKVVVEDYIIEDLIASITD